MKHLLSVFLAIFFSLSLLAQKLDYKARIVDSKTHEPLAFVNIKYASGNIGTSTNIDGYFSFKTELKSVSIHISYLGYDSKSITLQPFNNEIVEIELIQKSLTLNEVTVLPGENPAHRIIKNAIKNKELNDPEKLPAFSYTAYNRMHFTMIPDLKKIYPTDTLKLDTATISNFKKVNKKERLRNFMESQHLMLMETVSERSYNGPGKNNEKVIASKTSGLKQPYLVLLATQFQSFTIYGNDIQLGAKKYTSPICDACIGKYFYLIEDTLFNETGDTTFIISFRPSKGKNFKALEGVMHINSNKYAIENIKAEPTEVDTVMDLRIQQKYVLVSNSNWFPVELNTDLQIKNLALLFNDTIPINDSTAIATQQKFILQGIGKSYLDLINLNPDFSDKKFNQVEVNLGKNLDQTQADYFAPYRPDSLTQKDLNTYRVIDSLGKAENLDKKIAIFTALMTGVIPYHFINFEINRFFQYNRFEGLRLGSGFHTNNKLISWLSVGGYLAYGFNDEKWKYGYNLKLKNPNNSESFIQYKHINDTREPGKTLTNENWNVLSSEMFRLILLNPLDYIVSDEISLNFRALYYANLKLFTKRNAINPLQNVFINNKFSQPYMIDETGIVIRYAFREKFIENIFGNISKGTPCPIILFSVSTNLNTSYNDVNFIASEMKINHQFQTNFYGKTSICLKGGYINNDVPINKMYNGNGSNATYSIDAENTFQTMYPLEFFSPQYASLFLRHDFGSLLFKTGKFKPGIILCQNIGISAPLENDIKINYGIKSFENGFTESGLIFSSLIKASFAGYGIGIFYRYGNYSTPNIKENIFIKLSFGINF